MLPPMPDEDFKQPVRCLRLFPNGTAAIDMEDGADGESWLPLKRFRIGDLKTLSLTLEDADDRVKQADKDIQAQVGLDESIDFALAKLQDGEAEAGDLAKLAELSVKKAEYESALQRFLSSEDNPYPDVYIMLITAMAAAPRDTSALTRDSLPTWALGGTLMTMILNHVQISPFTGGTQQSGTPTPGA